MKVATILTVICITVLIFFVSCGNNPEKKAKKILDEAQTEFDSGEYVKALKSIDSLRINYPKAIETRKSALKLYQKIELKRAQDAVEVADKALQQANREYNAVKNHVDSLRNTGKLTIEELRSVNLMKAKCDSLQNVFDVECAKIKYIKVKIGE
ncbi:MAG: hypothetical protein LUC91_00550 [Prevotella sp.]|nr:hypothetical protein [Prevotella sp.]